MTTWARAVTARPKLMVTVAVLLVLLSGMWGLGVLDRLNLAGYVDPGSQSAQVESLVQNAVGRQTPDVVVIYSAPPGKTVDDIAPQVLECLQTIDPTALAKPIESYWTTSIRTTRKAMVSTDHSEGLAVLTLNGSDSDKLKTYMKLKPQLEIPGLRAQFTGFSALTDDYNIESKHDVVLAEAVAVPLTLLLLLIIFGGFVAASIPVIVGGLTIFGSLGALRVISLFTDVSAFALNVATVLGLGMAIDYGLFLTSRFREELDHGHSPREAAARTIQTAGRAVAFSAVLMTCAFAGVLASPISMMRSLGFGAMAAVIIAALLSLTAVPAALALLGSHVNAFPWRRGAVKTGEERSIALWGGVADWVMRRPAQIATLVVGALLVLAIPLIGFKPAGVDVNGLPRSSPVRGAQDALTARFPNATDGVTLVVRGVDGAAPPATAVDDVIAATQQVEGVRFVVWLSSAKDVVVLHAVLDAPDFSIAAVDTVAALRRVANPPGATLLIGGENAITADSQSAMLASFPLMLGIMLSATLVVMFLAFRSVVLPFKATAIAVLSLAATMGLLVWIFQDGHGNGLLGAEAGRLPFPAFIVVIAAVFGLSTDYELFLMSRMMEAHQSGATTREAVRTGVARTGRIITAAAALLIIVTGALGTSDVLLIKLLGLGMAVAILIDATLVRMLLVPALVVLMGRANWWVPHWSRAPQEPKGHSLESSTRSI